MIWGDIVVSHALSDPEIVRGLAAAFGVDPSGILVRWKSDDFPDPAEATVVCVVSERAEGFRLALWIFTYFDVEALSPVTAMKQFTRATQTEILLSDDSADPYTLTHIMPSGDVRGVNLDIERLDERGEYQIGRGRQ